MWHSNNKDHISSLQNPSNHVIVIMNQISYGRFSSKQRRNCEIDLFIVQADGKKMVDPSKQNALKSRLQMELLRPLRVAVVSKGPDTELLVANPVELSGKGRPLVFHDITLALKMSNTGIFSVITLYIYIVVFDSFHVVPMQMVIRVINLL